MIEPVIVIALGSLYVSLRVAWDTRFKPPKVVAFFPSITVWKFSHKNHDAASPIVVPCVVLTNIGAQPAVIEDIRLGFTVSGKSTYWSHPDLSVPSRAAEEPGEFFCDESSVDNDYSRMTLGHSFSGVILPAGVQSSVNFNFPGPSEDGPSITGSVRVDLEVWLRGNRRWSRIMTDNFDFTDDPFVPMEKTEKNTTRLLIIPSISRKQRRRQ